MEDIRFAPPKAVVDDRIGQDAFEAPPEVMKLIRAGCLAGMISAAITLVFTLVAIGGSPTLGFSAVNFLDVGLILALTFGVWRKSRVCAVLMLIYFVISKIMLLRQSVNPGGIVTGLLLGYLYVQGVRGAFEYHRLRRGWLARADQR
jgi:hypothetical protein